MGLELGLGIGSSKKEEAGERERRRKEGRIGLLAIVGLVFVKDIDCIIVCIVRSNEDMTDRYVGQAKKIIDVCDRPRRAGEEPAEF